MKKSLCIFLLAVLLPALGLGWLALRNAEEQRIILEKRTAELYQKETVAVADAVRSLMESERRTFQEVVGKLLAQEDGEKLAKNFSTRLAQNWPRNAVGFALNKDGTLLSPTLASARRNDAWNRFLTLNGAFLSGDAQVTVYPVPQDELQTTDNLRRSKSQLEGNLSLKSQTLAQAPVQMTTEAVMKKDLKVPASVAPEPPLKAEKRSNAKEYSSLVKPAYTPAPKAPAAPKAELKEKEKLALSAPAPAAAPAENNALLERAEETLSISVTPAPPVPVPAPAPLTDAVGIDNEAGASKSATVYETALPQQVVVTPYNTTRNVAPSWGFTANNPQLSQIVTATADFRALTATGTEGVISRFVQDRLEIIFWQRPPGAGDLIFGCLIDAGALRGLWPSTLPAPAPANSRWSAPVKDAYGVQSEYVLALLDEKARPVALQPETETGRDWKRPFVASEIGEILPHWEAALYLRHPQQLEKSATALRRNVTLLIAAALLAIAVGGWAVMADARRQVALAQKKTDFVSNVSHELKTPLTSIRMFAELMHDGHGASAEKHPQYLRIIMLEAERLTRLINNVLDFARMERRQKQYDKRPLDLHAVLTRIWEAQELHLRQNGFTTRWQAAPPPYPVVADEDALAQVLVNLLSNAEKYSGDRKEVELHSYLDGGFVCVSVLDRGVGVPTGEERKIFEAFYRAHDSLSSGIQGSGLGLTLAQRLAAEHRGEILYQARAEGGSNFTLRLPLAIRPEQTCA